MGFFSGGIARVRIDVSGLQPAAQSIVQSAVATYEKHLHPSLLSVVAHGSAVKGGYVAGGSDLDLALFVAPGVLDRHGALPLERAIALHRDLARIDPWPFRYLQAKAFARGEAPGPGFIPGAYCVVAGDPDVPVATAGALVADAHHRLAALDAEAVVARVSRSLLQHGEERLFRELRQLTTEVWPVLYHLLTLQPDADPLTVWRLSKPEAIDLTDARSDVGRQIRGFYTNIRRHYAAPPERASTALLALATGTAFLRAAAAWYAGQR